MVNEIQRLLIAVLFLAGVTNASAGEIVLYTSMPKENAEQLVSAFEAKTPGVKVQLFRAGSGQILNKLQGEFAARQVKADVVMLADEVSMADLKRDNRLYVYRDAPVKGMPKGSYDPGMSYFGTRIMTVGIIYNTRKTQLAPTSWADLVAGDSVKQTVMPSPLYSGAQLANLSLLTEMPGIGWPYFEKMAKGGVQMVEAGEMGGAQGRRGRLLSAGGDIERRAECRGCQETGRLPVVQGGAGTCRKAGIPPACRERARAGGISAAKPDQGDPRGRSRNRTRQQDEEALRRLVRRLAFWLSIPECQ
jgi:hypothetical protein